jgi:hypothetical protein
MPPNQLSDRAMSSWHQHLGLIAILIVPLIGSTAAYAVDDALMSVWHSDAITSGGRVVGCDLGVDGMGNTTTYFNLYIALKLDKRADQYRISTLVKLTAQRSNPANPFTFSPLRVHEAWFRTSSASTVGKLQRVVHQEQQENGYYLGGTDDPTLLPALMKGIHDGVVIGIQESEGGIDTVFQVRKGPPDDITQRYLGCLAAVRESLKQ